MPDTAPILGISQGRHLGDPHGWVVLRLLKLEPGESKVIDSPRAHIPAHLTVPGLRMTRECIFMPVWGWLIAAAVAKAMQYSVYEVQCASQAEMRHWLSGQNPNMSCACADADAAGVAGRVCLPYPVLLGAGLEDAAGACALI